jgi:hypothetical protein
VSWTFEGPPQALMQKILDDLEQAATESGHFYRDQAFVSLVGRYILEDHHGRVPEPALGVFLHESGKRLEALGPRRVAGFVVRVDDYALEAETEETMWFTVSLYRSALQVIVDDYASTPVPAWLHPDEFDEIDEQIRKSAEWQFPVDPERIPSQLAPTHWWWTLPQQLQRDRS